MAKIERQHPPELDAKVRATNFEEVSCGFTASQAATEAVRCLNCRHKPCVAGCPVGVNIPDFIMALKDDDIEGAYRIIKSTNNLPGVCGRVCPQEHQCEKVCVRAKMEGAVAIGALERYVSDNAQGTDLPSEQVACQKSAAVIGSGPAGLTCAADLAAAGVKVTVFEAFHRAGGVLVYGIPQFRLPKELVHKEIQQLIDMGVEIKLNTVVGKTIMLDELCQQYDAVFIGTGAGLPQFLNIPGENLNGVYSANEYLTRINLMQAYLENSHTPVYRGKNVAVFGAGNVAMDAARTAKRMGAESVKIVYRRSREEMPARAEEIRHAEEEGIEFLLLTSPVEILGDAGFVSGLKCVRMQLAQPDASGRRAPVEIADSEFTVDCDMVIVSIGTSPNPLLKESCESLKTTARGTIIVDADTMQTSIENIYAGGDAVTGAATVILAMGAGKLAAKHMLKKMNISCEITADADKPK